MTIPESIDAGDVPCVSRPVLQGTIGAETGKSADGVLVQFHPRRGLPPRVLQQVREYVDAHVESSISLEVLAGIAGLSISRFAHAFGQSEGMTPHEYVMQRRVQRARELLARTDLPLAEIACASGFSDQGHFTCRFQEHVGTTPSNYRWLIRG